MIPEKVQAFLRTHIKSAWALELLILLQSDPHRVWTAEQLTAELRSNPALVADILLSFKRAGLVAEDSADRFRYAPATADLADTVNELHAVYSERPLTLVREIISSPNEKIRSFIDAFRLKKGP